MLALGLTLTTGLIYAADQSQPPVPVPPYDGLKKTVAVDRFQVSETFGGGVTADGMTAMLSAALVKDGRFVVVERPGLAGVTAEQTLGQGRATTTETAAKSGQLIGASILVRGALTKFEPAAGGTSVSVGGLPVGSFLSALAPRAAIGNKNSVLEISLTLIDTTTGQVISTSAAQGTASSSSADLTLVNSNSGASAGISTFQTTPIGQAGEQAIIKAVEQIAIGMKGVPWSALVVDANEGTVYVNAGADRNVQSGLYLNAYRKGKVFTDPSTGVVLDVAMEKIGVIQINGVREKMSTAAVVSGQMPTRGDLLKLD
jgi:curli biogenesis system outer membrane secretion channel CsgG